MARVLKPPVQQDAQTNTEMLMIDIDGPPLAPLCAACGTHLMLTPSGHPFCSDPTCTEGFGVDILRQLFNGAPIGSPITLNQKPRR
jgi:hypothetical protein